MLKIGATEAFRQEDVNCQHLALRCEVETSEVCHNPALSDGYQIASLDTLIADAQTIV